MRNGKISTSDKFIKPSPRRMSSECSTSKKTIQLHSFTLKGFSTTKWATPSHLSQNSKKRPQSIKAGCFLWLNSNYFTSFLPVLPSRDFSSALTLVLVSSEVCHNLLHWWSRIRSAKRPLSKKLSQSTLAQCLTASSWNRWWTNFYATTTRRWKGHQNNFSWAKWNKT